MVSESNVEEIKKSIMEDITRNEKLMKTDINVFESARSNIPLQQSKTIDSSFDIPNDIFNQTLYLSMTHKLSAKQTKEMQRSGSFRDLIRENENRDPENFSTRGKYP